MDVPDWLWQGVVTNLAVDTFGLAVWLAYKNRKAIANRLRGRAPVLLSGVLDGGAPWAGELSVGFNETVTLNAIVSRHVRSRYNPYTGEWITSSTSYE